MRRGRADHGCRVRSGVTLRAASSPIIRAVRRRNGRRVNSQPHGHGRAVGLLIATVRDGRFATMPAPAALLKRTSRYCLGKAGQGISRKCGPKPGGGDVIEARGCADTDAARSKRVIAEVMAANPSQLAEYVGNGQVSAIAASHEVTAGKRIRAGQRLLSAARRARKAPGACCPLPVRAARGPATGRIDASARGDRAQDYPSGWELGEAMAPRAMAGALKSRAAVVAVRGQGAGEALLAQARTGCIRGAPATRLAEAGGWRLSATAR